MSWSDFLRRTVRFAIDHFDIPIALPQRHLYHSKLTITFLLFYLRWITFVAFWTFFFNRRSHHIKKRVCFKRCFHDIIVPNSSKNRALLGL